MSRPWDNDPTPTTDSRNHRYGIVSYEYTQNLERRLRYAERLIQLHLDSMDNLFGIVSTLADLDDYLDLARQEEAR